MSNKNVVGWCNRLWTDIQAASDDLETNADRELSSVTLNSSPFVKPVLFRGSLTWSAYHSCGPPANKLRIDEMRHRFLSARDIFTGEPLAAQDYDDWAVSFTRDCRRRRFAYENRRKYREIN